jgi:hypothetical protein
MPDVTPDDIESAARNTFAFLEHRPGCRLEVERQRWLFTTLAYVFDDVCFEVYLEFKDPDVDIRICQTVDGGPPKAWRVHEGRRVRLSLYEALRSGDDADQRLAADLRARLQRLPLGKPETMIPAIRVYAPALWQVIDRPQQYYDTLFARVH